MSHQHFLVICGKPGLLLLPHWLLLLPFNHGVCRCFASALPVPLRCLHGTHCPLLVASAMLYAFLFLCSDLLAHMKGSVTRLLTWWRLDTADKQAGDLLPW